MKKDDYIANGLKEYLSNLSVSPEMQKRMIENITGGKKMKRKMTLSLALAAAIMLALLSAVAVGTNVFDYFAGREARLGLIAKEAENITGEEIRHQDEKLGNVKAKIDSAYYDGTSLFVGVVIENSERIEPLTYACGALDGYERIVDMDMPAAQSEEEWEILQAYAAAVESGTPCGYARTHITLSDHTYVNGVDTPPYESLQESGDGGISRVLRKYENNLPAEVMNLEEINVSIKVYEIKYIQYFDGSETYTLNAGTSMLGEITARVPRTEAESLRYAGEAQIGGEAFTAECELSRMNGKLTLRARKGFFALRDCSADGYTWRELPWMVRIFDEDGKEYPVENDSNQPDALEIAFRGTGEFPQEMRVYLLYDYGADGFGFWPNREEGRGNVCIVLKTAE